MRLRLSKDAQGWDCGVTRHSVGVVALMPNLCAAIGILLLGAKMPVKLQRICRQRGVIVYGYRKPQRSENNCDKHGPSRGVR